ncbi:MAG TPA: NmrA family NAD(P)-binding protein [Terriglobales bacterium]|nr:NmrA family NAD(P)-binding protein [Terriglobales bacterium]
MFVVTGASGNTGSVVADQLLASGQKVRVVSRDPKHLASLIQRGAEPFAADLTDTPALARAFEGARGVYVLIPPKIDAPDIRGYQEKVSDSIAAALAAAKVSYAVALSSIGADKPAKTGPVLGLQKFEEKLNRISALNVLFIRAGYFMENLLPQVGVIQNFGMMAGPVRGDLRLPMIATRDIGAFAGDVLAKLDFTGKQTRELLGQRDVTYNEIAPIIGNAIGQPGLQYQQLPGAQLKPALTQMGMSPNMADLLLEMAESLNSGYMAALEPRSPQNTTPTSIEEFVQTDFVPRFQGKTAAA